jgi:hypothetical protein
VNEASPIAVVGLADSIATELATTGVPEPEVVVPPEVPPEVLEEDDEPLDDLLLFLAISTPATTPPMMASCRG